MQLSNTSSRPTTTQYGHQVPKLQAMIEPGCTLRVLAARARRSGQLDPIGLRGWKIRLFRIMTNDIAYAMMWTNLKKKMTTKMFPEETDKIERVDGRNIWVNKLLLGLHVKFYELPFHVDLMQGSMGTYDVIIGYGLVDEIQALCTVISPDRFVFLWKQNLNFSWRRKYSTYQTSGIFTVDIVPGAALVARSPYSIGPSRNDELARSTTRAFRPIGFIRPSSSPWVLQFLFVKKLSPIEVREEDISKTCLQNAIWDNMTSKFMPVFKDRHNQWTASLKNGQFVWGDKQEQHSSYGSRKLCSAPNGKGYFLCITPVIESMRRNYTTHDLELEPVVFDLKDLEALICMLPSVRMFTDNMSLQHNLIQKNLKMRLRLMVRKNGNQRRITLEPRTDGIPMPQWRSLVTLFDNLLDCDHARVPLIEVFYPSSSEKYVSRLKQRMQAARDMIGKRATMILKRKPMGLRVGDKVMSQVSLGRGARAKVPAQVLDRCEIPLVWRNVPVTTVVVWVLPLQTPLALSLGYSVTISLVLVLPLGAVLLEVAWSPTLKANDGIVAWGARAGSYSHGHGAQASCMLLHVGYGSAGLAVPAVSEASLSESWALPLSLVPPHNISLSLMHPSTVPSGSRYSGLLLHQLRAVPYYGHHAAPKLSRPRYPGPGVVQRGLLRTQLTKSQALRSHKLGDGSAISLCLIPAARDPRDPSTYVGLLGGGDGIGLLSSQQILGETGYFVRRLGAVANPSLDAISRLWVLVSEIKQTAAGSAGASRSLILLHLIIIIIRHRPLALIIPSCPLSAG
ncbi:hypothetical protein Tco_0393248 [Tanacetum coccineum]